MIQFDPQVPSIFFNTCAVHLDTDNTDSHRLVQTALQALTNYQLDANAIRILHQMAKDGNISHQVIGRYVLNNKQQQLPTEALFPFEIKEESGTVSAKRYEPDINLDLANPINGPAPKPGYVVTIPIVIGTNTNATNTKINNVLIKYRDEGFSKNAAVSQQRCDSNLTVVIGGNRCKSIEKNLNRHFKNYVKHYTNNNGVKALLIGFLWEPVWIRGKRKVSVKEVRAYYTILKRLDATLAEGYRKKLEQPEAGLNARVPYQDIRETIKDADATKRAVRHLRSLNPARLVYLAVMDPDFLGLRNDRRGLFSHYNRLIKNHIAQHHIGPAAASTGYKAPNDTVPILLHGIKLDQRVREAVCQALPLATYLPEPNMILSVELNKETVAESFINRNSVNKESRQIIAHILTQRALMPSVAIAFQTLGAITTTIPDRFYTGKNRGVLAIGVNKIGEINILKSLRGIRQSIVNPLWGWAMNIENALSIKGTDVRKQLSIVFKQFDPINLAKTQKQGRYSAKNSYIPMLRTYAIHENILRRAIELYETNPHLRANFIADAQVIALLNEGADRSRDTIGLSIQERANYYALFNSRLSNIIEAYEALVNLGLTRAKASAIVNAARLSGIAMVDVLNGIN